MNRTTGFCICIPGNYNEATSNFSKTSVINAGNNSGNFPWMNLIIAKNDTIENKMTACLLKEANVLRQVKRK